MQRKIFSASKTLTSNSNTIMEIIIGREAGKDQPRLCITANGNKVLIGEAGAVPKSVSRNHCRIEKGNDSKMTITLIAENNQLFVNGVEYKERVITKDDFIELGADRYRLDLKAVLEAVANTPKQPAKNGQDITVNISKLKKVWDDYETAKTRIQIKNGRMGAISAIPGVLSMSSIGLAAFMPNSRIIFIGVAAAMALIFAIIRWKGANATPQKMKEIQNKFEDKYVCPNCGHYMNVKSYKLLLNDGSCPYCRAKFTGVKP